MAKDSTTTILLLGAVGVGVWGYFQGWFAQWGLAPAASGALTAAQKAALAAAAAAQGAAAGTTTAAPAVTPVPALGTTVTNANDVLRQVAANDAYILPDAATFAEFQGALPGGYQTVTTSDKGQILLRPDVYAAVQTLIANNVSRASAAGASAQSIQNASQVSLANIQQTMSTAGLSGLGDYQRHVFSRTGRIRPVRVA